MQQNNLKGRVLKDEDKEDYLLGKLMEETDYNDFVSTNEFIKQLRS